MKRIKFEVDKTFLFFITPAIRFMSVYRFEERKYEYILCFSWIKLHLSVLLYTKTEFER